MALEGHSQYIQLAWVCLHTASWRLKCNTGIDHTALEPFTQVGNSWQNKKQVSLDITPLIGMPLLDNGGSCKLTAVLLPEKWPTMTLTFDHLTLKTVLAMPTHMVDSWAKFHRNLSTKYRDVTECEIGVNGWTATDSNRWMTWTTMLFAYYCWSRHKNQISNKSDVLIWYFLPNWQSLGRKVYMASLWLDSTR